MADPALPPIERNLAARLDLLAPPALPADFAARLAAAAQATPQVPPLASLPPTRGRWRTIGRRTRLGIAVGSLALVGLGSVSAAAAGYLGEPVNHAVHRIPVVGKLIEKVIPEKRRLHRTETNHAAGLRHAAGHETFGHLGPEPRPAVADAPALVPAPVQPIIAIPGLSGAAMHTPPPWRYPGPLPRTFPPGPRRQAAIAAFRAFRAEHPLPPEVVVARQRRQAAIRAQRRAWREGHGAPISGQRGPLAPANPPDPFATSVPPGAMPPQPFPVQTQVAQPQARGAIVDPVAREQLRIERRRARIEARRQGIDPPAARFQRHWIAPGARGRFHFGQGPGSKNQ